MHAISVSRISLRLRLERRWVGEMRVGGSCKLGCEAAEIRVTVVGRVSLELHDEDGGWGKQVR